MKEAVGGTWLFGIVIVFIALFTCFVSVTTNYSRCYKLKDEVLMTIEHYHGINENSVKTINEYLKGIGYSSTGECPNDGECWIGFNLSNSNINNSYAANNNYCISKHPIISKNDDEITSGPVGHPESAYYGVTIFFRLNWPIFQSFFNIGITGETSIIYLPKDYSEVKDRCG